MNIAKRALISLKGSSFYAMQEFLVGGLAEYRPAGTGPATLSMAQNTSEPGWLQE